MARGQTMNSQTMLALGSFAGAAIQAVADIAAWRDRWNLSHAKGATNTKRNPPLWILICWFLGVILTSVLGTFLLMYHPQPEVKTVIQIVEKPIPCPATKTGPATAKSGKGGVSNAHSGSGDTTTINPNK